ncbi:MAG: hypothetical protein AB7V46_20135 [Thermomicrobiales bacterium]
MIQRRLAAHLVFALIVGFPALSSAQTSANPGVRQAEFRTLPAIVLSNGKLELTVLPEGGAMTSIILSDDPQKLSPLWDRLRVDQEENRPIRATVSTGHFVCVDGFGPVSQEERAAGLAMHGEAHLLPWKTLKSERQGNTAVLAQSVDMPIVGETYSRTIQMVDGENVVHVRGVLRNNMGFDRPVNWAEHATIGSPFLERGVTVVDMSANRALTKTYDASQPNRRRLASNQEFQWPMAPLVKGGTVDLRAAPVTDVASGDHTGHLMSPGGPHAWVTALNPKQRLILGYIYKTDEFPWMQTWENFPTTGMMARGLEFGTQAFDVPRRQVFMQGKLFDQQLFRLLPAKSEIQATYLMFLARAPEGFQKVDRVTLKDGVITVEDQKSKQTITLKASLGL